MARRKSSPVGCVFLGIGILWISSKCGGQSATPSPTPPPVYQRAPTAAELASDRAQAAAMEAKARKEDAEVRAYQKQRQEQAENQAAEDRLNYIRNQQYQAQSQAQQNTSGPTVTHDPGVMIGMPGNSDYDNGRGYYSGRVRGYDGAPKNQHVSGYTRKDGTHVSSYDRRSKR